MKRFVPWLTVLWLPVCVIRAQEQPSAKNRIDWPRSSVTVVFAPDFNRQRSSQSLAAMTGMRAAPTGGPVEFSAPGGLTAIKVGPESAMASFVEITEDGTRQSGCLRLPAVLQRMKKNGPPARQRSTEVANDK